MDGIRITSHSFKENGGTTISYEVTTTGEKPMLLGRIYDEGEATLYVVPFLSTSGQRADMLSALAFLLQAANTPRPGDVKAFRLHLKNRAEKKPWHTLWEGALDYADTVLGQEAKAA